MSRKEGVVFGKFQEDDRRFGLRQFQTLDRSQEDLLSFTLGSVVGEGVDGGMEGEDVILGLELNQDSVSERGHWGGGGGGGGLGCGVA